MPTNLSLKASQNWPYSALNKFRLTALFLLSPLFFFGQTLTGLWTGALSNDSSTVRKDQSFEIVLTEYNGKVAGYSRSEFIVDDTLYYVMKRVKGKIEGDVCEVVDDEIISYNFRGKLDKGVKVTSIFRKNKNDSTWYLDGTWKTNATKKYYAVTGKVSLEEEKDLMASKIFPHLEELKLANDIAFYNERKEGVPIVKMAKPEKIKTEYSTKAPPLINNPEVAVVIAKPVLQKAAAKPDAEVAETSLASTTAKKMPVMTDALAEKTTGPGATEDHEEVLAIKKPGAALPKTDTKLIQEKGITYTPSTTLTASGNTADLKVAETKEEISTLDKPVADLPKTNTRNISSTEHTNQPANTLVASGNTADLKIAEAKEDIAGLDKPVAELPKTNTRNIASTENTHKPANTLVASGNTADLKIAEAKQDQVALVKPGTDLPRTDTRTITGTTNPLTIPSVTKTKAENKVPQNRTVVTKPNDIAVNKTAVENKENRIATVAKTVDKPVTPAPPVTSNNTVKANNAVPKQAAVVTTSTKVTPAVVNTPVQEKTAPVTAVSVVPMEKKPAVDIIAKAAQIAGRKSEFSQIVSFTSDSLELSLYDNGEIDGDVVSIYMNGEVVMSKQELKASAIKKTIYITPGNEDFTLVLFAENLGKYPPNTGLLVVHDGEDVYNLRFSSDFEKNAGIIFRRKK